MKLYEAIATIIHEFGKEIVTNAKVINVFNDYNAFEESKTFKVILKNLIAEGYMDQMMYVRDWSASQNHIISNFIAATSFNEANATYVIQSLAYGLGYVKAAPVYQPSVSGRQASVSSHQTSSSATSRNKSSQGKQQPQPSANAPSYQGVVLDKTPSQIEKLSEASQRKYKEAAEAYLENIIEFKSDFEKELGVKINTFVEFDGSTITPRFEITGKIKVKYEYDITFYILLYDQNNRMMSKDSVTVGEKRGSFEVADQVILANQYHKVGNIKRIVVYWEKD